MMTIVLQRWSMPLFYVYCADKLMLGKQKGGDISPWLESVMSTNDPV